MASTPSKSSTSLQQAKSRLEAAIERLERAIERRGAQSAGSAIEANTALDAAHSEIRELRETNQVVSARLDAAIGKMKVLVDD